MLKKRIYSFLILKKAVFSPSGFRFKFTKLGKVSVSEARVSLDYLV